jgi:hypothetical protein
VNGKFADLKRTAIACALVLSAATVAYAQQQDAARNAVCEQNRLKCQKDWAQSNSFGVPVTPPDKTKMCWDGFYACTGAGSATQGPAPSAKPDAAPKAVSLPPMKRFEMRSDNYIEECRIDGTEVRCTSRMEGLSPPLTHYESTMTGRISGSVITGVTSGHSTSKILGPCSLQQAEWSLSLTVTLRANGEATVQSGPGQTRNTISGSGGCAQTNTGTFPGTQGTISWRVIE